MNPIDVIKARFSKVKDDASNSLYQNGRVLGNVISGIGRDIANSPIVKGNIPSKEEQLSRLPLTAQKDAQLLRTQYQNIQPLEAVKMATLKSYRLPFISPSSPEYQNLTTEQQLGSQSPRLLSSLAGVAPLSNALTTAKGIAGVGATLGIGGGLNKAMGGSFIEGVKGTAETLPSMYGIGQVTNPLIANTASRISSKFTNPVVQTLANRTATGLANIPEGVVMSGGINQPYTPLNAGIDFGTGFLFGNAVDARSTVRKNLSQEEIKSIETKIPKFREALTLADNEDRRIMEGFLDLIRTGKVEGKKATPEMKKYVFKQAQVIGEGLGLDPVASNKKFADAFETFLDAHKRLTPTDVLGANKINLVAKDNTKGLRNKINDPLEYLKAEKIKINAKSILKEADKQEILNMKQSKKFRETVDKADLEAKVSNIARIIKDNTGDWADNEIKSVSKELGESVNWKDKPMLLLNRETMDRNFEDVMGNQSRAMKVKFLDPIKKSDADRIRWVNSEKKQINNLGIKIDSKESELLQKYGEKLISLEDLKSQLPDTWEKVVKANDVFRQKYDSYLDQINTVLKKNGYDPIPKRADYFRHFQEVSDVLEQFGIPTKSDLIPTDINGLSADFKPGKNFFESALPRLGERTAYDAVEGMEKYIDGASKQIYLTDSIQRLRTLEKTLRAENAGTTHLSNFVANLTEYTNGIAGKKSMMDRSAEGILGRRVFSLLNWMKKRSGANMVGANISSALTNFIPFTQSLATTDKTSFAKGMLDTIKATFKDDGFVDKSDFLTRRVGTDRLHTAFWDNLTDKAMWPMKAIDSFVSQSIVRAKYDEGIKKGLSDAIALDRANKYANSLIAGRSIGDMPNLFNSKILGALTQFQLEVNNQVSFMLKDMPKMYNKKGYASALAQVFLYSYIYNNIYEQMFGRRPALDPIGLTQNTYEDYTNPDMKKRQATKNLVGNISEQVPFAQVLTEGGRVPMMSAIPNPMAMVNGESNPNKEMMKLLWGFGFPGGGMQAKKTLEGINAYNQKGSYTDKGNLRYPIEQNVPNLARMAIAGQYSTPEARQYFRTGTTPLGEKQTQQYKNAGSQGVDIYNTIMQNRRDNRAKESMPNVTKSGAGIYQITDPETGKETTIDISQPIVKPTPTGLEELDKKARSTYYSRIGTRISHVYKLYEAKKITADEANKMINELKTQQAKIKTKKASTKKAKAKRLKVVKALKLDMPKLEPVKLAKLSSQRSAPRIRLSNNSVNVGQRPRLQLDPRIRAGM